jgi:release factor glutamine methyltransferase
MLPTPDTSHVPYRRVYEPAEDSFLLLDTLSSPSESAFLSSRFTLPASPPLVLEVGPGSGVILAFLTVHANTIFGTCGVMTAGVDVNRFACLATRETVHKAERAAVADDAIEKPGLFLDTIQGDLVSCLRSGEVDVLVFNPPYVPTPTLPSSMSGSADGREGEALFQEESHLLELAYAGGRDGMEVTNRLISELPDVLSARGCAYVLLCAQNRPEDIKTRIRNFGAEWRVETVGSSGKHGGWEKLIVIRIWRDCGGNY